MFAVIFAVASFFIASAIAAPASSSSTTSSVVNAPSVNECNYTGGMVCCNSLDFDQGSIQETLLSITNLSIDKDLLVGHGCSPMFGLDNTCNAQTACCEKTYSGIGVNCNNLILF